ncbi:TAXI family TRAP transporter solute-binding subunit [Corallincola luteus]|uniref:TRAP transporter solute receptor, TAXI family n=2 Tax=Corallincola TaxID=1775176 RepID=A0A368NGJ4_9GAMM|nr:TAXI family TRAP transporter solute-binding subunit [Corallincola holothuriorum]RCU48744.1 hypothetical protein DU002_13190 [Corallincola holothuriorum]TCI01711.1 TAXI family TRAP transporter solute-binding subunit [Corallincola luteus]
MRTRLFILGLIWLALISATVLWFISTQETRLTIAAGPRHSESFELASAIAKVYNQQNELSQIDVFETGGSSDNIRLLQAGHVDFATTQADAQVNEKSTAVASLFVDAYQLIVNDASNINSFNELQGKFVVTAPLISGQHDSFWFVADHYGLTQDDLTALPMSEEAANFAMVMGQVDAAYRVRAPGNRAIRALVRNQQMHIVPIEHAEALSLRHSSLSAGVVPAGAYRGSPPVPERDLPTAVLDRVLLAHKDLDYEVVNELTALLFEHHSELAAHSKLAGFIRPITDDSDIPIPLHPGAQGYYDREKPGFLQKNTRMLASFIYVGAFVSSLGLALRSRVMRRRKVRVSEYTLQLMNIAEQAQQTQENAQLHELKDELVKILNTVVTDLSKDKVTQEEFEHFSFTWQAVNTLVRDRLAFANGME